MHRQFGDRGVLLVSDGDVAGDVGSSPPGRSIYSYPISQRFNPRPGDEIISMTPEQRAAFWAGHANFQRGPLLTPEALEASKLRARALLLGRPSVGGVDSGRWWSKYALGLRIAAFWRRIKK